MGLQRTKCQRCGRSMMVADRKDGTLRDGPYICGRKSCKKSVVKL